LSRYRDQSTIVKNTSAIAGGAVRALFAVLAILIILSTMGVSVTPVVASLGITSLAVALALQPTLENFFSGIQLVMDKPIRIGDFIELDSGERGFVEKIGWRSTWVRMLPNNIVIMPNSKLSNSKLINYYYPERELSVPVDVGVHYNSDLDHVEKVCLDVANTILQQHEYGVKTYQPFVLFHTFDNSSINLTVMLRTREYFNRFFIKSAFIKMLKKRFDEEGIVIPFPITALNLEQEGAAQSTDSATPKS
jgi:small-conductance mechanosensitive channel